MSEKENIINFPNKIADAIRRESIQPIELGNGEFLVDSTNEPTMTEKERLVAHSHTQYFYTGNDLGLIKEQFDGWRVCGAYDFNNPPIIEATEDYTFSLEPVFFSQILQHLCSQKGDGDKMYHASMMGLKYDVFTVRNPHKEGPEYETFFNSHLMSVSDEEEYSEEHSALYPGLVMKIKRPKACIVAYIDINGEKCLEELQGEWCRYFIQGYELTRGRPFWKDASKLNLQRAKKARKKLLGGIWNGELI